MSTVASPQPEKQHGIGFWMQRVLAEIDGVAASFAAGPVHDLRVALRRCRSIAEGISAVDPDKSWRRMRKASKALFAGLGQLRDAQVMAEWIEKLGEKEAPATLRLRTYAAQQEAVARAEAARALEGFDRKQWEKWMPALEARAGRIREPNLVFKVLALEALKSARVLHQAALRNRSKVALHRLRIGIKRFRYVVENFLPAHHQQWGGELKHMQDLLGEVHDLDVLWAAALKMRAFATPEEQTHWRERIAQERGARVAVYREHMMGPQSLWLKWRAGLPQGAALERAVLAKLRAWSQALNPRPGHTRRVLRISLTLYDALDRAMVIKAQANGRVTRRDLLRVACLAHEVGRTHGGGHQKRSQHMLERLVVPPGWQAEDLKIAALAARYHRGKLPSARSQELQALPASARRTVMLLAGVLRLAEALEPFKAPGASPLKLAREGPIISIFAAGYSDHGREAERIAAARHLLESSLRMPVLVRPAAR